MRFEWRDYDDFEKAIIEAWLDPNARKMTGIDGSFEEEYKYWRDENDSRSDSELWCKVVFRDDIPVAVLLIGCNENEFTLSDYVYRKGTD